jgi:hypothetical protein
MPCAKRWPRPRWMTMYSMKTPPSIGWNAWPRRNWARKRPCWCLAARWATLSACSRIVSVGTACSSATAHTSSSTRWAAYRPWADCFPTSSAMQTTAPCPSLLWKRRSNPLISIARPPGSFAWRTRIISVTALPCLSNTWRRWELWLDEETSSCTSMAPACSTRRRPWR